MESTKRVAASVLFVLLALFQAADVVFADDAVVLPKGWWRLFSDTNVYFTITERFDSNGNVVPLGADFNTTLDSRVFSDLSAVEAGFGLPSGSANLGDSVVTVNRNWVRKVFQPAYGITDRFTVGANIPYNWMKNRINAQLATGSATVGKTAIGTGFGAPLAPLSGPFPDTTALTTEDIQSLLGAGLDTNGDGTIDIAGFGFKRFQTWEGEGIGDIEVGGKYQYHKSKNFRAAFTGGVRLPTGRVDDPDDLADFGWGQGTYSLLFMFQQDLMLQREGLGKKLGFPEPGDFLINTTVRYDLSLPDKQTLRVCSPRQPVCAEKDDVRRNLGDFIQAEAETRVGVFIEGLILSGLYNYGYKFKDTYSGDKNLPYGDLAIGSDGYEHVYNVSLTYTTIPLAETGRFPIPMFLKISYRDRFAGNNDFTKSQYLGFTAAVFF